MGVNSQAPATAATAATPHAQLLGCNPGPYEVALFVDANYIGTCVVKGVGDHIVYGSRYGEGWYPVENDSVTSIKVGSNARVTLFEESWYAGRAETFTESDPDLIDNAIGNNAASAMKVERTCRPGENEVAVYEDPNYGGRCMVKGVGTYVNPYEGHLYPLDEDIASSIKVGSKARATLFENSYLDGRAETFLANDPDLRDNTIGTDTMSSIQVLESCEPGPLRVALYADVNYGGICVIKGEGSYVDSGALARLPNDSASSIMVGSAARATLFQHEMYNGAAETFTANDPNLTDNTIGNDRVSSMKVLESCEPGPKQVALFAGINYTGICVVMGAGSYGDSGALAPLPNDSASSIKVGSTGRATLFQHGMFNGTQESLTANDPDLTDNAIGNDTVSSMKVLESCEPGLKQVALFADVYYGGICVVMSLGSYVDSGALAPLPNDSASSIKVGSTGRATLFQHGMYNGAQESLAANDPDLTDNAIGNDTVSSMKVLEESCEPGPDQVALFEDVHYGGSCALLNANAYIPERFAPLPNDSASSVKVGSNVQGDLYSDVNYRGRGEAFTKSDPDLRDNYVGNDNVSSIYISKPVNRHGYTWN